MAQQQIRKEIDSIYIPKNKIRIVSATSLFDGHDVTINIMRRILQSSGAEVIHLGHNRSAEDIVNTAIQEDVQAITVTSYQGGHMEFFKYMYDLLRERDSGHIKIFGGGGGTILPSEIEGLHAYGIARIYTPDDGRAMGLQGMINDLLSQIDYALGNIDSNSILENIRQESINDLSKLISALENENKSARPVMEKISLELKSLPHIPVLGITGTGGAGKSSIVDELVRRFLTDFKDKRIAIISVDPSKRKTGGALLGDRIRMNSIDSERVYMRSLATRQSNLALSKHIPEIISILKFAGFDLIVLETSGIGQSDTEIVGLSDTSLYVMTPDYGAATQLEKIDMLDYADLVAINKFDKSGAIDALRDVRKQYRRNNLLWDSKDEELPIYGTIASMFNDPGVDDLYRAVIKAISDKGSSPLVSTYKGTSKSNLERYIIPPKRTRYLSEITETIHDYNIWVSKQRETAQKLYGIKKAIKLLNENKTSNNEAKKELERLYQKTSKELDPDNWKILEDWNNKLERYHNDIYVYKVRDREIKTETYTNSLSMNRIARISLPTYEGYGDILRWSLQENVPGEFPYTAGVFPFKRQNEDPTRMFAGEGGPERTNKRFHYVSLNTPAKRLSTAFDSVTLYGENPDYRPDIYGKIGNSGVSIACLDDAKKLYSGFDLYNPSTSVSMTINGPAAIVLAFFLNAAVDQQCELYIQENGLEKEVRNKIKDIYKKIGQRIPEYNGELPEGNDGLGLMLLGVTGDQVLSKEVYEKIKSKTLSQVRGTVQADILKEDQAQNTCIFSTETSLTIQGDIQEYFIDHNIQNFYSISISGYHMAEAGANPITQLAFTLANGFTFVEYFLFRGMDIDDFAPNFSFFFSNGLDPEYTVIGRVARRIWAKAMKLKYGANERSQKLKYHIQTSGRSLHAQEISFNDIRTTLQALTAVYDNCNSLHTNAYDEAITTPTEESVRRAIAIQLIINRELGSVKNENPLQGSFFVEELTDLVEDSVLKEFDRLTERGGVLGAMEKMYQRGKIQEESLHYETLKNSGEYPVIGVNTYLSDEGSPTITPKEVTRSTKDEKDYQVEFVKSVSSRYKKESSEVIKALQNAVINNENTFEKIMEAVKFCTLGEITHSLYEVGGQYRRNM
ncbi:MAG: methylmalonyl-CoA mutase family protein [Candidatus Dadabacteria bacterium]|nr:methylmalonyl-CoA mutase family protein [Candidatus Dadabacteria bacterium]